MSNDPTIHYEKLPGTGYRQSLPGWAMLLLFFVIGIFVFLLRGKRMQVWQGPDHLLIVDWDGYREYYKRIRYGGIQWITIQPDSTFVAQNVALVIIAITAAAFGVSVTGSGGEYILYGLAALLVIIAVVHFSRGQTCKVQLGTAVQVEQLVSLKRVRTAIKVVDRLRPLILQAQAGLAPLTSAGAGESPVLTEAQPQSALPVEPEGQAAPEQAPVPSVQPTTEPQA